MPDSPPPPPPTTNLDATPIQDEAAREQSQRLSEEHSLPPGHVPGYEIDRLLGEGSYGSVWLAHELKTGKRVAIKFYTRRRGLNWALLSREVEKLAVLYTSRNIVGLLDVGWDHEPPYFVMEYLESGSLDAQLDAGAIPVEDAVRIGTAIARALGHAHRSGILHCDLKPANVLLDVDSEPRLGDFGQSRLTTEQSPSLGTLFYMAPEQAVVDGVPDVRWDVYALGAMLFHMVTGRPPYATPEDEARLSAAGTLPLRLETYRQIIRESPRPEQHRTVPGVDHALAALIDGCLERDPTERIPSIQRVLDLLEQRERRRSGRALVALGFLGPILFLFAMYWIAESAVPRIVAAAEQNLIDRALASDGVSARILAKSVQQELRWREATLARIAAEPEVLELIEHSQELSDEQLLRLCSREGGPDSVTAAVYKRMRQTATAEERQLAADGRTPDDSWFITDARGRQIFRAPPHAPDRETTLGRQFHWRDYFHGRGRDLDSDIDSSAVELRTSPGVSTPFRSQATGQYMIAIAMPVRDPETGQPRGVLARTIHLTALLQQWEIGLHENAEAPTHTDLSADPEPRFLALADTRGDCMTLLDHPAMTSEVVADLSDEDHDSLLQIAPKTAASLQSNRLIDHYRDPIGTLVREYDGEWLAAAAPVGNTGWMAIVQERRDNTVQPVESLRRVFLRAGVWSIGIFSGLLLLLWYLIQRASM